MHSLLYYYDYYYSVSPLAAPKNTLNVATRDAVDVGRTLWIFACQSILLLEVRLHRSLLHLRSAAKGLGHKQHSAHWGIVHFITTRRLAFAIAAAGT